MENEIVKPGNKTSEFRLAVVSQVAGLLVIGGVITQTEMDTLSAGLTAIVGGIVMIYPTVRYIAGRNALKLKEVIEMIKNR